MRTYKKQGNFRILFYILIYANFLNFAEVDAEDSTFFTAQPDSLLISESPRESRETLEENGAESGLVNLLVCEGLIANLSCPINRHIVIQLANFGRFGIQPCNPTKATDINTQCYNKDRTTTVLKQRCDGMRRCSVMADVVSFGGYDPCPNNYKYLDVTYACAKSASDDAILATTTTSSSTTTTTSTSTAKNSVFTYVEDNSINTEEPPSTVSSYARHAHCESRYARRMLWPKTQLGHLARLSCPDGGRRGPAEWMCSMSGEWTPDTGPDLSRCSTELIRRLRAEVDDNEEEMKRELSRNQALVIQFEILQELSTFTKQRSLMGGDLIDSVHILFKIVTQLFPNEKFSNEVMSFAKNINLSEFFVDIIGFLLKEEQRGAWMDVSANERKNLAETLLNVLPIVLKHSAQYRFSMDEMVNENDKSLNADANTIFAEMNTIPAAASAYVTLPVNQQDAVVTIELPAGILKKSIINGAENVNALYVSYDRLLGEYLSSKSSLDALLAAETMNEDEKALEKRIIVSRILTFSSFSTAFDVVPKNDNESVAQKLILTFNLLSTNTSDNRREADNEVLRCLRWRHGDGVSDERWSTADCFLVTVNGTHATCNCDVAKELLKFSPQHFALARDILKQKEAALNDGENNFFDVLYDTVFSSYGLAVSCVFSLLFAAIALLCFCGFGDAQNSLQICSRKNLCFAFCAFEAILLAGIFASNTNEYGLCGWLDLVLRYFALSVFVWMLLDSFILYSLICQNNMSNCKLRSYACGYGVPMVFSAVSFFFGEFNTVNVDGHCWQDMATMHSRRDGNFVGFFLAPSAVALALAAFFLARVFVATCQRNCQLAGYMPCKQNLLNKQQQQQRIENLYFGGMDSIIASSSTTSAPGLSLLSARWCLKTSAAMQILLASCLSSAVLWRFSIPHEGALNALIYASAFAFFNCVVGVAALFGFIFFDETMQQNYEKWLLSKNSSLLTQLYHRLSLSSTSGSTTMSNNGNKGGQAKSSYVKAAKCVVGGENGGRNLLLSDAPSPLSSHFDCPHSASSASTNTTVAPLSAATTLAKCFDSPDVRDCNYTRKANNCSACCSVVSCGCHYGAKSFNNNSVGNCGGSVCAHSSVMPIHNRSCRHYGIINGTQFCSTLNLHQQPNCCFNSRIYNNNNNCNYNSSCCAENGAMYDYATIPYGDLIKQSQQEFRPGSNTPLASLLLRSSANEVSDINCGQHSTSAASVAGNNNMSGGQLRPICVETPRVPQLAPSNATPTKCAFVHPLERLKSGDENDSWQTSDSIFQMAMANNIASMTENAQTEEPVRFRGNHPPPKFPPPPPPSQDVSICENHFDERSCQPNYLNGHAYGQPAYTNPASMGCVQTSTTTTAATAAAVAAAQQKQLRHVVAAMSGRGTPPSPISLSGASSSSSSARAATLVLRMDLSRNEPLFTQEVQNDIDNED